MFHPWSRLPTELRGHILSHSVHSDNPITNRSHDLNMGSRFAALNALISTRNTELVSVALDTCGLASPWTESSMLMRRRLQVQQVRLPTTLLRHQERDTLAFCMEAQRTDISLFPTDWTCGSSRDRTTADVPLDVGH